MTVRPNLRKHPPAPNFDSVARAYRTLEWIAYGNVLEQARFFHLQRWAGARDLLLLGDGDGRCLEQVLRFAPHSSVVSIDASAGMIAQARDRLSAADRGRVSFIRTDLRDAPLEAAGFDGVATMFVLDCFTDQEVSELAVNIRRCLRPGGSLMYADFERPASGPGRLWSRLLLPAMYLFFCLSSRLATRRLPETAKALRAAGLTLGATRAWWGGFIRSSVWACDRE